MSELDKAIERFQRVTIGILDTADAHIKAINASLGIIADAEKQARAEMRAAEFTNCKACQSGLVLFLKDTPDADTQTIQAVTETLWEQCPTCIEEYRQALASNTCVHGLTEAENCQTCWDTWADANAPEDVMVDAPSRWEVENV